jgi:type I restriction enzyme M protein
MQWIAPSEKSADNAALEKRLWDAANQLRANSDYDTFGRVYEYFLGEFAMSEGQGGGEFYTPSSIVRLLTEILNLRRTRDLLLPRLLSGQVELKKEVA